MSDFIWAFVCGGLLCVVAQILIDKTNSAILKEEFISYFDDSDSEHNLLKII